MFTHVRPALVSLVFFTLLTGGIYPLVVTGIGQLLFARQANGSLLEPGGKPVGSELIGQAYSDPKYFWGRPSATSPYPYHAAASSGSNQGPLNPALAEAVAVRIKALKDADPDNKWSVPVDLVTASGSGLDPHISPAAADYQVRRVARIRGIAPARVRTLVAQHTQGRQLGLLGEPRVNVLLLNLALDQPE
jgi:K+-transporting ATPase ATPase C chain